MAKIIDWAKAKLLPTPKHEPMSEKAGSFDVNSPQLLEMIRSGNAGSTVSAEQAFRITTVFACIKVLAEAVGTIPCNLYKLKGDRRERQPENKLHYLVNRSPNDFMTSSEFWEWAIVSLALHGNAYVWMNRTRSGKVVQFLPLPFTAVSVHVEAQNIVSYQVTVGVNGVDKHYNVPPADMLHFKGLSLDGITGVSPITYNSAMLLGARESQTYQTNVLLNGASPKGVLQTEGVLDDDAYERIKASWEASHQGTNNAGSVAILEAGLEFKGMSMSPADIKLMEQMKYTRSEIAGLYGVPPHRIGDLDKSTYTNIEALSRMFHRDTLKPWLNRFEKRLNHTLLDTATQEFKFDSTEYLAGDLETEVAAYTAMLDRGVVSPNEFRRRMGMNPRDGGDEYASISNNPQQETGNENEDQNEADSPSPDQESE
jgi:HK97 family phage portal protein